MNLSIVIPHFNDHTRLAEAVADVQTRCAPDAELVIIDDHSSIPGMLPAGKNILTHHNEFNLGPSASRNLGVNLASGEYVMFLDSDDLLLGSPTDVVTSVKNLHGAPDIILCNMETGPLPKPLLAHQHCLRRFEEDILFSKLIHFSPHLYRREFLIDNSVLFPTDLRLGEDLVFLLTSLARSESLLVVDETTYQYRRRSGSLSSRPYNLEDHYTLLERVPELFISTLSDFPDHLQVRLSMTFIYRVRNAVRALASFDSVDPPRILRALRRLSNLGLADSAHLREAAAVTWSERLDHLLELLATSEDGVVLAFLKENERALLP